MNPLVKRVVLHGKGREAQEQAQKMVTTEFLDTSILPNYRLMTNYATGTGKGKAALDLAVVFWERISKNPIMIGVWTEPARDNVWPEQINLWGNKHEAFDNIMIHCYASFHKLKGLHIGLLILDEAQHITELGAEFFDNNTVDGIIILTATEPKDPVKKAIIHNLTAGRRLIIRVDDAIEAEIVNDFIIKKVIIELDNVEKYKIFANSNTLYTDRTGYEKHCSLVDAAIRSRDSIRIKFASIARMRFVGNTKSKFFAAQHIQNQFRVEGKRFITIANSIEQANHLSHHVFHSKSSKIHYDEFKAGKINELVSIKMIREAENFHNLGRGLIVQVDKSSNNAVQTIGRFLRLPVGQISEISILCARKTFDEYKWVPSALSDTNPSKIQTVRLDKALYWKANIVPPSFEF